MLQKKNHHIEIDFLPIILILSPVYAFHLTAGRLFPIYLVTFILASIQLLEKVLHRDQLRTVRSIWRELASNDAFFFYYYKQSIFGSGNCHRIDRFFSVSRTKSVPLRFLHFPISSYSMTWEIAQNLQKYHSKVFNCNHMETRTREI